MYVYQQNSKKGCWYMSKKIKIESEEDIKTAYAALCIMKMLYRQGKLPKAQYKEMVRLCSPHFNTSDF